MRNMPAIPENLKWFERFTPNPVELLMDTRDPRIRYFLIKNVLQADSQSMELKLSKKMLNESRDRKKILFTLEKEEKRYRANPPASEEDRITALMNITGLLAEAWDYSCHKRMDAIKDAIIFLLKQQNEDGLFPGPVHFNAYVIETMLKYDFEGNKLVEKAIRGLVRLQNEDGGWGQAGNRSDIWATLKVLSACSFHSVMRKRIKVHQGAKFILEHLMDENAGGIISGKQAWDFLEYGYNDLKIYRGGTLRVLEVMARLGFPPEDRKIKNLLKWLDEVRLKSGFWPGLVHKSLEANESVTLRVVRIFQLYYLLSGDKKTIKTYKIIRSSKFNNRTVTGSEDLPELPDLPELEVDTDIDAEEDDEQ